MPDSLPTRADKTPNPARTASDVAGTLSTTWEAAHAWLAAEPFSRAGLYAGVEIHAFLNLWPQRAGFPPPP